MNYLILSFLKNNVLKCIKNYIRLKRWSSGHAKKSILSSLAVVFMTIVFVACSQPVTELPSSTGRLGVLASSSSVIFDTTDGWYSVDGGPRIAEGRFRNNNVTPGSQGVRIRLFDFTNINLDTAVRFEAVGRYPLGLLATGDIIIECDLSLAGQAGIDGNDGFGIVGGSGGGGGGDTSNPGSKGGIGGTGFAGIGGSSTGGGNGGPGASGGGGSFIIAAPNGITGNGSILLGSGVGAIYGDFTFSGTVSVPVVTEAGNPLDVTSVNEVHVFPYDTWQSLAPADIGLSGGSGAGGGGGDGQGVPAEEKEEDGISLEER